MKTKEDFIKKISHMKICSEILNTAIDLWGNDVPTVIFSSLGKGVAEKFHNFNEKDVSEIFNAIEIGLNSSNESLADLIATGLLESLYIAATEKFSNWEKIKLNLGVHSYEYLNIWVNKNPLEIKPKNQNNKKNLELKLAPNKKFIECIDLKIK